MITVLDTFVLSLHILMFYRSISIFLSPRGLHEHARFSMRSPIVSARACCTGRAAAAKGLSQDVYAAYRDIADVCHAGLQHWLHKPAENLALARRH